MIRSSKPSPLTSPAPATEGPAIVVGIDAVEAEAVRAVEGREIEAAAEARGSAEHHVALAGIVFAAPVGAAEPRRSGRRSRRR